MHHGRMNRRRITHHPSLWLRWLLSSCLGLTALLACASAFAAESPPLRAQVAAMLERERLTGAAWMLLGDDGTIAVDAAGVRRVGGAALRPDDQFQVGSIAKTVIAAGVLRLVTQKRLSLDAPVASWLPEVALDNPWAPAHPVRLRHLLDHTAGLEDASLALVLSTTATPDQALATAFARKGMRLPVRTRPGSEYSYSNFGYVLAAMVIERVTGQRYETVLDAELLRPLGMRDSTFAHVAATDDGPADGPGVVFGHVDGPVAQAAEPMHLRPAGQFLTTAHDMGRFARFLMSDGRIDGELLIDPALLAQMGHNRETVASQAGLAASYGLGLWRRDRHGAIGRCHEGSTTGFRAMFCLGFTPQFPDHATNRHRAFFIVFNTDSETADYRAFDAMMIRALDLPPPRAVQRAPAPAADDPDAWLGWYARMPGKVPAFEYLDLLFNPAHISRSATGLTLRPLQAAPVELHPAGGRLYVAADRIDASHVLIVGRDGPEWSNGFSTYRKVSFWRLLAYWANLALGLAGLLHVLMAGSLRLIRGASVFHADPIRSRRSGWSSSPSRSPSPWSPSAGSGWATSRLRVWRSQQRPPRSRWRRPSGSGAPCVAPPVDALLPGAATCGRCSRFCNGAWCSPSGECCRCAPGHEGLSTRCDSRHGCPIDLGNTAVDADRSHKRSAPQTKSPANGRAFLSCVLRAGRR